MDTTQLLKGVLEFIGEGLGDSAPSTRFMGAASTRLDVGEPKEFWNVIGSASDHGLGDPSHRRRDRPHSGKAFRGGSHISR